MNFYRNNLISGIIPQLSVAKPVLVPSSGLNLWLDASDLSLSDGQMVAQWNDKSGNGNNATQTSDTLKPIFKLNIINSKPVVRFDGSNDYFQIPKTALTGVSSAITIFVISATIVKTQFTFVAYPDDGNNRLGTHTPWSDGTLYFDFGNLNTTGRLSGAWGGTAGTSYLWTYQAYSNYMGVRRNGNTILSKSSSSTLDISPKSYLALGGYPGDVCLQGDIAEILIYNRQLTTDEITLVEGYLKSKYNLS